MYKKTLTISHVDVVSDIVLSVNKVYILNCNSSYSSRSDLIITIRTLFIRLSVGHKNVLSELKCELRSCHETNNWVRKKKTVNTPLFEFFV